MKLITAKMAEIADTLRSERKQMAKQHEETKIGEITAGQVLGGIRGVPALICDTSTVNADEGLRIRNIPILELTKAQPEDIFFLLCTGSFPNDNERTELHELFTQNSSVPYYVWNVLEAMPRDSHPMVMLSTAILVMERESRFRAAYDTGKGKDKLWQFMLEDAFLLLSRITTIAAAIYRMRFDKGERIAPRTDLDWGANFAYMLGLPDNNSRFTELIRMYLVLHSDHEGGNVSAFTANTVSSALSDLFYSFSAGLNGLAGPLHGLANQECLSFVLELHEKFGGKIPSDDELAKEMWALLNSGQVIPGYGHAVLRVTDPRFTAFQSASLRSMRSTSSCRSNQRDARRYSRCFGLIGENQAKVTVNLFTPTYGPSDTGTGTANWCASSAARTPKPSIVARCSVHAIMRSGRRNP